MNQHIVDITIIWPDDKWTQGEEEDYLDGCLEGIREHFLNFPIKNEEQKRTITNSMGRVYALVHINPVKIRESA